MNVSEKVVISNCKMSSPTDTIFRETLSSIFSRWAGLQIAVREGFGGVHSKQKADFMVDVVCEFFRLNNFNLVVFLSACSNLNLFLENFDLSDLEDYIAEYLDNEFCWVVDPMNDGSDLAVICTEICRCFSECQHGRGEEVLAHYKSLPCPSTVQCQRLAVEDDSSSEEEDENQEMGSSRPAASCVSAVASQSVAGTSTNVNGTSPMEEGDNEDNGWTVVKRGK